MYYSERRRYTRNAKPSKCIDNFENLLKEIDDERISWIVIREMSGFLSKMFEIFHEVNKMDNLELKARIIHKDFICPERYFKKSKRMANRVMRLRAAIEYKESKYLTLYTKDTERHLILGITDETASKIIESECNYWPIGNEEIKELARKTMLLYHYIPAITKALIQTKRRELGVDNNSQRF